MVFQYLAYLRYLPFLVDLITFIRKAETVFRGGNATGDVKRSFVTGEFTQLVRAAANAGLLDSKLADRIIDGLPALISIIVALMNSTGGVPMLPTVPMGLVGQQQAMSGKVRE